MSLTEAQALEMLRSDDLIGVGMEADSLRRKLHPGNIVTYQIDRNINYTNICTEYCSFCAFYRPVGSPEGYVLPLETIYQKIEETIALGGTGVLMQGGLHPDLKMDYYENLLRAIKARYPQLHLHCLSAPEILNIAEICGITVREVISRLVDAGLDSIPGAGAEILDDEGRHRTAGPVSQVDHRRRGRGAGRCWRSRRSPAAATGRPPTPATGCPGGRSRRWP